MSTPPLSLDRIVSEALALLAEEGLDKVTLRKLASRLDVQAMSLYWYIESKDELYRKMSNAVFTDCLNSIPECSCWKTWLKALGLELWRAQHEVRDAARLTFGAKQSDIALRELADQIIAPLLAFGIGRSDALKMQSSVQAMVIGWTGFDQSFGEELEQVVPVKATMEDSLDALIAGWETILARRASAPASEGRTEPALPS